MFASVPVPIFCPFLPFFCPRDPRPVLVEARGGLELKLGGVATDRVVVPDTLRGRPRGVLLSCSIPQAVTPSRCIERIAEGFPFGL